MPRFRALITDYAWPDLDIERAVLSEVDAELTAAADGAEDTLAAAAAGCDAILTNWAKVTRRVIDAAGPCRIVARLGIGLDNIDVAHATSRGIVVTNVPDYCLVEVAEHALALLLALARKIGYYHQQTKSGRYALQEGPMLSRVAGQTLGIVGLGNIGRLLAEKAQGLGLAVIATSRSGKSPVAGVEIVALDELLGRSDYVSLHLPAVAETRGIIGAAQLALMKPTAYLVNTARGALVDHAALAAALAAGRIAGAALDVQATEPPPLGQPPYNDPRVIVTPHAAFASAESIADLRRRAALQVAACLKGHRPQHVVNPQALENDG